MRRRWSWGCSPRWRSRSWNWVCHWQGWPPPSMSGSECSICNVRRTNRMTTVLSSGELPLKDEHDIVRGRQAVRRMTQELAFSLVDQTKMVTAASELARNALIYGGGGML